MHNTIWQAQWRYLFVMLVKGYETSGVKVSRRFVLMLNEELRGVRKRKWNADCFIVFQTVILQ